MNVNVLIFGKIFLKMDNGFISAKKIQFDLCNCICPYEEHDLKYNKFI